MRPRLRKREDESLTEEDAERNRALLQLNGSRTTAHRQRVNGDFEAADNRAAEYEA